MIDDEKFKAGAGLKKSIFFLKKLLKN